MPEWPVVQVRRELEAEQAAALVGRPVPAAEPTVTEAAAARDADTGETVYAYLPLRDAGGLRRAVLSIGYSRLTRASGTTNLSRNFGYHPRRPTYGRESCGTAALTSEAPGASLELARWARIMEDALNAIEPDVVSADQQVMATVDPSWKLGNSTLWTSGVINRSSRLPYHRDRFNFPIWSAMPVFRRHMAGGYLHLPEYGATFACRDGWAVFFAGHRLVHGVTPMTLTHPDGYRISIVYYALAGMKDCHTAAVEAAYGRRRRTEREREIARRIVAGERLPR